MKHLKEEMIKFNNNRLNQCSSRLKRTGESLVLTVTSTPLRVLTQTLWKLHRQVAIIQKVQ